MTFEDQLYQGVCEVFPDISVRKFSGWLGKSSGYWSSIRSQGLEISNSSLGHLVDVLTVLLTVLDEDDLRNDAESCCDWLQDCDADKSMS